MIHHTSCIIHHEKSYMIHHTSYIIHHENIAKHTSSIIHHTSHSTHHNHTSYNTLSTAPHVMAQEWCHRMQFFYNRWEDEGAVDEAAALEYQSTHEFVTLARTATGDLKARCDWLSSFCPKRSSSSSHKR